MYKVGDIINIGYYGGFHNQTLIKTKAKIIKVFGNFLYIKVYLSHGGYKEMFGYDFQLKEMEDSYNQ